MNRPELRRHAAALTLLLAGCTGMASAPAPDAVLLGEQHDAPGHQALHRAEVEHWVAQGRLAAVLLEMAEEGASTAGLGPQAAPQEVRMALRWNDAAWPWAVYGPVVMAAVRAGVPVVGANLPRQRMRDAMSDTTLDSVLDAGALARQQEAIRLGHCGLLPQAQIAPMTRVQLARDQSMARAVAAAAVPDKTVLLLAGSAHVDPALGVPRHLPQGLRVQARLHPHDGTAPPKDYCEELRQQLQRPAAVIR